MKRIQVLDRGWVQLGDCMGGVEVLSGGRGSEWGL